jgi:hypothetical protein
MSNSFKIRSKVKRSKNSAHCHKLIASVAQAAAHELYDSLMMDQLLYEVWKKRFPELGSKQLEEEFVKMYWGKCIPFARATLAHLLGKPIDEAQKESIMEALLLDKSLMRGRARLEEAIMAPPSLRELLN